MFNKKDRKKLQDISQYLEQLSIIMGSTIADASTTLAQLTETVIWLEQNPKKYNIQFDTKWSVGEDEIQYGTIVEYLYEHKLHRAHLPDVGVSDSSRLASLTLDYKQARIIIEITDDKTNRFIINMITNEVQKEST